MTASKQLSLAEISSRFLCASIKTLDDNQNSLNMRMQDNWQIPKANLPQGNWELLFDSQQTNPQTLCRMYISKHHGGNSFLSGVPTEKTCGMHSEKIITHNTQLFLNTTKKPGQPYNYCGP